MEIEDWQLKHTFIILAGMFATLPMFLLNVSMPLLYTALMLFPASLALFFVKDFNSDAVIFHIDTVGLFLGLYLWPAFCVMYPYVPVIMVIAGYILRVQDVQVPIITVGLTITTFIVGCDDLTIAFLLLDTAVAVSAVMVKYLS